jgi:hypothetical protein
MLDGMNNDLLMVLLERHMHTTCAKNIHETNETSKDKQIYRRPLQAYSGVPT